MAPGKIKRCVQFRVNVGTASAITEPDCQRNLFTRREGAYTSNCKPRVKHNRTRISLRSICIRCRISLQSFCDVDHLISYSRQTIYYYSKFSYSSNNFISFIYFLSTFLFLLFLLKPKLRRSDYFLTS